MEAVRDMLRSVGVAISTTKTLLKTAITGLLRLGVVLLAAYLFAIGIFYFWEPRANNAANDANNAQTANDNTQQNLNRDHRLRESQRCAVATKQRRRRVQEQSDSEDEAKLRNLFAARNTKAMLLQQTYPYIVDIPEQQSEESVKLATYKARSSVERLKSGAVMPTTDHMRNFVEFSTESKSIASAAEASTSVKRKPFKRVKYSISLQLSPQLIEKSSTCFSIKSATGKDLIAAQSTPEQLQMSWDALSTISKSTTCPSALNQSELNSKLSCKSLQKYAGDINSPQPNSANSTEATKPRYSFSFRLQTLRNAIKFKRTSKSKLAKKSSAENLQQQVAPPTNSTQDAAKPMRKLISNSTTHLTNEATSSTPATTTYTTQQTSIAVPFQGLTDAMLPDFYSFGNAAQAATKPVAAQETTNPSTSSLCASSQNSKPDCSANETTTNAEVSASENTTAETLKDCTSNAELRESEISDELISIPQPQTSSSAEQATSSAEQATSSTQSATLQHTCNAYLTQDSNCKFLPHNKSSVFATQFNELANPPAQASDNNMSSLQNANAAAALRLATISQRAKDAILSQHSNSPQCSNPANEREDAAVASAQTNINSSTTENAHNS